MSMLLLRLFYEFFKVGLFSVGGGLATLPFLYAMGEKTQWFTHTDVTNLIAISESTPGPIGVNAATYVGFLTDGLPGSIVATLGLITPAIIVILLISQVLERFRHSTLVDNAFYGLRPASTALIASAGLLVAKTTFLAGMAVRWPQVALAAVLLFATQKTDWHPVIYIAFAAVVGVVFHLGT